MAIVPSLISNYPTPQDVVSITATSVLFTPIPLPNVEGSLQEGDTALYTFAPDELEVEIKKADTSVVSLDRSSMQIEVFDEAQDNITDAFILRYSIPDFIISLNRSTSVPRESIFGKQLRLVLKFDALTAADNDGGTVGEFIGDETVNNMLQ